ncbi:unnamed protein product [Prorocentrum cordatum]|uniref:DNA (cytosine-5-)-methyltransferase n=1 Tax=Prorocentrum cordatum TaxID=2364126 RepID=A0ABN9V224_9DINO|nr:unnamed protein product [Polarella glacialis]
MGKKRKEKQFEIPEQNSKSLKSLLPPDSQRAALPGPGAQLLQQVEVPKASADAELGSPRSASVAAGAAAGASECACDVAGVGLAAAGASAAAGGSPREGQTQAAASEGACPGGGSGDTKEPSGVLQEPASSPPRARMSSPRSQAGEAGAIRSDDPASAVAVGAAAGASAGAGAAGAGTVAGGMPREEQTHAAANVGACPAVGGSGDTQELSGGLQKPAINLPPAMDASTVAELGSLRSQAGQAGATSPCDPVSAVAAGVTASAWRQAASAASDGAHAAGVGLAAAGASAAASGVPREKQTQAAANVGACPAVGGSGDTQEPSGSSPKPASSLPPAMVAPAEAEMGSPHSQAGHAGVISPCDRASALVMDSAAASASAAAGGGMPCEGQTQAAANVGACPAGGGSGEEPSGVLQEPSGGVGDAKEPGGLAAAQQQPSPAAGGMPRDEQTQAAANVAASAGGSIDIDIDLLDVDGMGDDAEIRSIDDNDGDLACMGGVEPKLRKHLRLLHDSAGPKARERLGVSLGALRTSLQGGPLRIGTGCSGSESPVKVMFGMVQFWNEVLGVEIPIKHVLSAENDTRVQDFIRAHFQPEILADDICDLPSGMCHNVISNITVEVPSVHIWIFGSECDNYSMLNQFTRMELPMQAKSGKSGTTADGGMGYVKKYRPWVVILENVPNIDKDPGNFRDSDLTGVIKALNSMGYYTHHKVYDPISAGVPQSRRRVYLVAFLSSRKAVDQLATDFQAPNWLMDVQMYLQRWSHLGARIPIEDFMLPNDHPEVLTWLANRLDDRTRDKKRYKTFKYEVDHKQLFDQNFGGRIPVPPTESEYEHFGVAAGVVHLPTRMKESVLFHRALVGDQSAWDLPFMRERVVDLNKTLSWQMGGEDNWFAPCLVSSARPYFLKALRDMTGVEAMCLQGWEPDDIVQSSACGRFSDPTLLSIGGNAMSCFILNIVSLAAFMFSDWDVAMSCQAQAHSEQGVGAEVQHADDLEGSCLGPGSTSDSDVIALDSE